jgi:6-phosphogluconate dehydrogenase
MSKMDIGLVGLAVMGQNLVLNMADKGFGVAVFNRTVEKVDRFMTQRAADRNITGTHSLGELCGALKRPRTVMLMIKAGKPVDDLIESLVPLLEKGDIIIDAGNSLFTDTERRSEHVEKEGILYMGAGVSGGEEGALKGPSIMPGGSKKAWEHVKCLLQKTAAKVEDGSPCCEYMGPGGAGHYVKMVHNGIEYGDSQLICEAYFLLKRILWLSYAEMQRIFSEWNKGELGSYLIEITADILGRKDTDTGKPIVEIILDRAGQKGTGKWASQNALDLGVVASTIVEAVFARSISEIKRQRVGASKVLQGPRETFDGDRDAFVDAVRDALYASKVCSYAQGFVQLKAASEAYGWKLDLGLIASYGRSFSTALKRRLTGIPDSPISCSIPFLRGLLRRIRKTGGGW